MTTILCVLNVAAWCVALPGIYLWLTQEVSWHGVVNDLPTPRKIKRAWWVEETLPEAETALSK